MDSTKQPSLDRVRQPVPAATWRSGLSAAAVAFALTLLAQPTFAQPEYPNRPIHFVVAFAPGGITDIVARLVGEKLSDRLGQNVVIDNKGGAAGALGAKLVAGAEPDGHTLLVTTTALAIGAAASPSAVDPRSQLTPIALAASTPTIFATNIGNTAKNLSEFVRDHGRSLTYSSAGAGTTEHLTAAYVLGKLPGTEATHVPYRGGAEAVNAVLGGHVDLTAATPPSSLSFIQDRKINVLAVASHKRVPLLPDVPTLAEAGLPDVDNASWIAVLGPAKMDPKVVERLSTEINQVLRLPELRERLGQMGYDMKEMPQPEFAKYVSTEVTKWSEIIKATGVVLN
jgi:tripartite-type tricarboxylate transporter receptor subunit TctC